MIRGFMILAACLATFGCCPRTGSVPLDGNDTALYRGPYLGQVPPGATPAVFAPGTVSTSLHDDCPAVFGPDGRDVYFRKWAVPHDIVGHMRMGDNGVWSRPELFRPDGANIFLHPVFIPGTDMALFSGFRLRDGETEPTRANWQATRRGDRWVDWQWSELNELPGAGIWSMTADGTACLQAPARDGNGGREFYTSHWNGDHWDPPARLEIPELAGGSTPCIAPDGSYLIFNDAGRDDGLGGLDLYVTFRGEDGAWSVPRNLGAPVNTAFDEKFAGISPDGAYLFYVGNQVPERGRAYLDLSYDELMSMNEGPGNGLGRGDVYWVSTEVVTALRPVGGP